MSCNYTLVDSNWELEFNNCTNKNNFFTAYSCPSEPSTSCDDTHCSIEDCNMTSVGGGHILLITVGFFALVGSIIYIINKKK